MARHQRIRRAAFAAVYLPVVSISILIVAEVAVRLLRLAPALPSQYGAFMADPHLPYRPKPHSVLSGTSSEGEFEFEYRHNSFGFRDVERSLEKPDGVFRILGLGDSFAYGGAVSLEQGYLYRLEQKLNDRRGHHPRVEVINTGIPRFFPEPERMLLEHYGLDFSPDMILVGFVPNDVIDTYLGLEAITVAESGFLTTREAAELGRTGTFLLKHSHVGRILLRRFVAARIGARYTPRLDAVYEPEGFHEPAWRRVEREYGEMVRIAESIDVPIVFLHIPQSGPWSERHAYPAERLAAWSAGNGAWFVDALEPLLRAGPHEDLYYLKDGHCRPAGYEVIAEALFEKLDGSGLVP